MIEMSELRPAKVRQRKKSTAINLPTPASMELNSRGIL